MKRPYPTALGNLAAALLATSACRPDPPAAAEQPAKTPTPTEAAAPNAPSASTAAADTLHLPDGQVAELHPATAATFNRLPASTLPNLPNDPAAEPLPTAQGKVRRLGLELPFRWPKACGPR